MLEGHQQNVNGIAFTRDGKAVVSVGYDATAHIWPLHGRGSPLVAPLPSPLNAAVAAPDSEIIAAGADGKVYFLASAGEQLYAVEASSTPITSLAISDNGERVAAASIGGSVVIIDRRTRTLARTLLGSGPSVWSVVFFPDNRTLLTGGADRMIRRWDSDNRRADRHNRDRRLRGSARRLCWRSGRAGVSRLRRLSYAQA